MREITELVKPQEVFDLEDTFTTQSIGIAKDIADLYTKKKGASAVILDKWNFYLMLALIWEAGRMNGIREERKRRRKGGN